MPSYRLYTISLAAFSAILSIVLTHSLSAEETTRPTQQRNKDLLAHSTILVDHRHWTIVPKAAVIHVPSTLQNKVALAPKGTFLSFKKFLTLNSTWIYAMPVRLEYARGHKRFEENQFEHLKNMHKVVIATHKRGPITLHKNAYPLPPKQTQTSSN